MPALQSDLPNGNENAKVGIYSFNHLIYSRKIIEELLLHTYRWRIEIKYKAEIEL